MKRSKIQKILDAEKIAAGEVVERPANVVKELIENSIDAGANEIRVIVKRAGKSLIQLIDDGIGIPPDEIEIAFDRHTSSKITKIEDLDNLISLGFRGEALASIAAVSQVEIISRIEEEEFGVKLLIAGGKVIQKEEISCPVGTNIRVKNLFYNVPARKKFLKKDNTELGHITDIMQRYALAFPQLHFIYIHNELTILNCPAQNDLKTTVFHIYGKKIAKNMESIDYKEGELGLHGLIGHSDISKKSRTYSSLYINNRYIISDLLFRAVQEAYKDILMIGKYPFFILFLDINPAFVDFNIHPKKLHIRFEDEDFIYNKVYNIIRDFIEVKFIKKQDKFLKTEISQFSSYKDEEPKMDSWIESESFRESIEISRITSNHVNKNELSIRDQVDEKFQKSIQLDITDQIVDKIAEKEKLPETYIREKYIISENFPKIRLISKTGQLSNKIYILLEGINENGEAGMYILDQHAASERINKEYFLRLYEATKKDVQKLISPLKIDVSPSERFFLLSNLYEINKLGFKFEHFGGNTFILRELPTIIKKLPKTELVIEIIGDLTEIGKDRSFSEIKDQVINYLACHKSIRGGEDLSLVSIRKLLSDLAKCKDPFHCAHGRPTLKFISIKELDKLFKRLV
ncbi:MAG: DNA mismatch repair endonuclease MutL [Candidatus Hermodarchaeota archaeon]